MLILSSNGFFKLKDNELKKAGFLAKPREELTPINPLIFNSGIMRKLEDSLILLKQKEQGKKLKLINKELETYQEEYREQRARGAYIASICQPEASYDLSVAAQQQSPGTEEVVILNKRLN